MATVKGEQETIPSQGVMEMMGFTDTGASFAILRTAGMVGSVAVMDGPCIRDAGATSYSPGSAVIIYFMSDLETISSVGVANMIGFTAMSAVILLSWARPLPMVSGILSRTLRLARTLSSYKEP